MRTGLFIVTLTALITSLSIVANQDVINTEFNNVIFLTLLLIIICQSLIGIIVTFNDIITLIKNYKTSKNSLKKGIISNSI